MREIVEHVRDVASKKGVAFCDARFFEQRTSLFARQDGRADKVFFEQQSGIGVRVLYDGAWGFACTDELTNEAAEECLEQALALAREASKNIGEPAAVAQLEPVQDAVQGPCERDPASVRASEKMALVEAQEKRAIELAGDFLANTRAQYLESRTREIVANTLGTLVESEYTRTQLGVVVTVREGDVRQQAAETKNALAGFEFVSQFSPEEIAGVAARRALDLLRAQRAPAGTFPVVLHPSVVGVFIHEALGHNAEADGYVAGESILEGRLGQRIASPLLNVVDDSTIAGSWGSFFYDSEGVPGRRRQIIKDGVLVGLMHSLETAAKLGAQPTGSARAMSHAHPPIVRMSNTIVEPGTRPVQEIIAEIDRGILLEKGQWGYVICSRGQYTCHAGHGRMIRNGELAEMIRDVSVSGLILDTLNDIDAVSQEFEMLTFGGMCGKDGQGMYVNGGGPYVRVKQLVVGGQQ